VDDIVEGMRERNSARPAPPGAQQTNPLTGS